MGFEGVRGFVRGLVTFRGFEGVEGFVGFETFGRF